MNSENSKTTDPHRLLLNLLDKINLKRNEKYVALSVLSIYYRRMENIKKLYKTINLKYQLQVGIINLNYLLVYILYQLFKAILSISLKTMKQ